MYKKLLILGLICSFKNAKCQLDEEIEFSPKNIDIQKGTGLTEYQLIPILKFLKGEEDHCNWIPEYPIITELINQMNLKKGCEIGVAYGLQSKYFLENSSIEKLYSIDPFQHFPGYDDVMNLPQEYFDVMFYRVALRLAAFEERSVLLRQKSVEAAAKFQDDSLDFVYIDGDHSYKAVSDDLEAWVPKIRSGGLVSGDDFVVFPSTARAVNDFVKKNKNIELIVKGNKWWFIKP